MVRYPKSLEGFNSDSHKITSFKTTYFPEFNDFLIK